MTLRVLIERCSNERANVSLYVAVCLPVILSFLVLAVDVSQFQSQKETAQAKADSITLHAARLLPDSEKALVYVNDAVASANEFVLSKPPEITSERVSISLEGGIESVFDFLIEISGNASQVFTYREASTAVRVPQDVVLILPDDNTLRPRAPDVWGNDADWPASRYFNFVNAPVISGQPPTENDLYWSEWWNDFQLDDYRRWMTQSCFNPVFSSIKSSAISFVDHIYASDANRLGVLFTPGDDSLLAYSIVQPLDFPGEVASWAKYWEPPTYISDEACVLFSDSTESDDPRYAIFTKPRFALEDEGQSNCSSIIEKKTWGSIFYPDGNLSSCYLTEQLSAREAIYYRAARDTAHRADASNVLDALKEAIVQQQQSDDSIEAELLRRRGNLYVSPVRRVIVFADAFPSISSTDLERTVASIQSGGREVQIDIVLFDHQGLSPSQSAELRSVASALQSGDVPNIEIYLAENQNVLIQNILPSLMSKNAEVVLRD